MKFAESDPEVKVWYDKTIRKVRVASTPGEIDVPAWVQWDALDDQLQRRLEASR